MVKRPRERVKSTRKREDNGNAEPRPGDHAVSEAKQVCETDVGIDQIKDGAMIVRHDTNKIGELKKVERKSPTLGAKPE